MKPSCGSTLQAGEPQGPSAKLAIRIFYGLVPAVLGGFSALVVFVLPLGRAQHRQSIGRWTGTGVSLNDLTLKIQFREEKQYKWNMYEHVISWFSVVVCFLSWTGCLWPLRFLVIHCHDFGVLGHDGLLGKHLECSFLVPPVVKISKKKQQLRINLDVSTITCRITSSFLRNQIP